MTPKEKAEEMVEKYLKTIIDFPYIDTEDGDCIGTGYMTHSSAVKCAINSVDEIVNHFPQVEPHLGFDFWNNVNLELQSIDENT